MDTCRCPCITGTSPDRGSTSLQRPARCRQTDCQMRHDDANDASNCPAHPFRFRARTSRISLSSTAFFGLPHRTSSHSRESGVVTLLISEQDSRKNQLNPKTHDPPRHRHPGVRRRSANRLDQFQHASRARPLSAPTLGWLFCREVGKATPEAAHPRDAVMLECHGPKTSLITGSQMSSCQTTDGIPPNGKRRSHNTACHSMATQLRLERRQA
jgi:hypothetical protein